MADFIFYGNLSSQDIITNFPVANDFTLDTIAGNGVKYLTLSSKTLTFPSTPPTCFGYTFVKWNNMANGTGSSTAYPGDTVTWGGSQEHLVYAIWEETDPGYVITKLTHGGNTYWFKDVVSHYLTSNSTLDATKLTGTIPSSCYTNTTYSRATNSTAGLIKPWYYHSAASTGPTTGTDSTAVTVNAISTTSGKYYAVESDSNGRMFVNVPWSSGSSTTVTITAANWNSTTTCTKSVTGVTASNTVIVSPAPGSINDYTSNGVYCYSQAAGSLTFKCDTTPTSSITVNVLIIN